MALYYYLSPASTPMSSLLDHSLAMTFQGYFMQPYGPDCSDPHGDWYASTVQDWEVLLGEHSNWVCICILCVIRKGKLPYSSHFFLSRQQVENTNIMQEFAGFQIYTGVWVNWSRGRLAGSTLTISTGHGGLLSAFLAIFISLTGIAFWRITSFALHQIRAGRALQDGLHHQQQLIFRNTGTASGAFWQILQLPMFWQHSARSPWLRTLPLALLALINVVVFAIAAIFSFEVTKAAGKGVLIRSPNCGWLGYENLDTKDLSSAFSTVILKDTTEAAAYTQNCYGEDSNGLRCNRYVQKKILWRTNVNASCPFDNELCFFGKTGAMEMDTGPIDSHHALGINFPKADRITYRKVATCSPIKTPHKYHTTLNDTNPNHIAYGDTYERFFFGPISASWNWTYQYNRHAIVESYPYTLK